jgi:hypothetical protein
MSHTSGDTSLILRRFVLAIVVLGLLGTVTELVLLEHYEDSLQIVPLFFIGLALMTIAGHVVAPRAGSVWLLRAVMSVLVVSGVLGVVLHYRGSLEFQLEMDPTQSGWDLFAKVLHAKAPPALAPGVMAQLGLLGLVYTYRHPSTRRPSPDSPKGASS